MRIGPFRRLWLTLGLSSLGDWLGLLATGAFAAGHVSGSTAKGAAFGGVIVFKMLPALVLGPVAGVFADRIDRRLTMVVCDVLRFALFASIPLAAKVTHSSAETVGWALIATFLIEAITMFWTPAKEAAVPNLVPGRLEAANQVTLITTYGVAPVLAALVLSLFARLTLPINSTDLALYLNACTFLAAAVVVLTIKEISTRTTSAAPTERPPGLFGALLDGWRFVRSTPVVRGLIQGMFGAFAAGGVVVGTAIFYSRSLGGGDASFSLLFAMLFIGLGLGMALGPKVVKTLSRRRWFGMSIVLSGAAVALLFLTPHLSIAVVLTVLVGVGAGMAFLSGTTLLGNEVADEMRGRVFAFVQSMVRVVLMVTTGLSALIGGIGASRRIGTASVHVDVSAARVLLLVAGLLAVGTGILAFHRMDDKPGVPVLRDLIGAVRGRPLGIPEAHPGEGFFVVFEGGEGAGKSTQARRLGEALEARGHEVVLTREPGATPIGERLRGILLDPQSEGLSPRAEALLYAADRAHHVAAVIRPALARRAVVISDRYVDSSLAYQGAGRALAAEEIAWLSEWATGGLQPDLVVLLDVDPSLGLDRAGRRGPVDRLENETVGFHERVRRSFLDLAAVDTSRYLVVDAHRDADSIAEAVLARVLASAPEPPSETADVTEPAAPTMAEVDQ